MEGAGLLDIEKICDMLMLEEDSIKKLLQKFAAILPDMVAEIQSTIDDDDMVSVKRLGHKLKGIAGNFRIDALQLIGEELESISEHKENIDSIMKNLHKTVELLTAEISATC